MTATLDRCLQLFDIILPLRCAICGDCGAQVCRQCRESFAAAPIIWRPASPRIPAVAALGPYRGSLRCAVLGLKFRNRRSAAKSLGSILGQKLERGVDAIVPVPLHQRRLNHRGFNQAEAIAAGIGSALGAPLFLDAVVRVRHTQAQSRLASAQRRSNLANAFAVGSQANGLRGKRVLIVDDVVTTGATIAACTSALRTAGAGAIIAAALAIRL